ncbi:MAG: hypothetical protein COA94_03595 [Rickettsiales bacterium]|nr:MAG: hypothetical protein COA94_03595 [Rickettsiales bacterium]
MGVLLVFGILLTVKCRYMLFGVEIGLDMGIVIGFLVLTLAVGMGHGKSVKTIKDYALGGRNFSTGALVATIVATWASGSGFFVTMSKTYSDGLYYMFASFGLGVSFFITAFLLVPRMGEFLGKVSIAEAMGDLYGQNVRIITAIAGTIGAAGSIAGQFKVFGNIFSYFLHIPNYIAVITAGFIATLYSAFGGIRAVAFTDILQAVAFGIIIPMVGFIIWGEFYNEGFSFSQAASDPKFNLDILFDSGNPEFLGMLALFFHFCKPTLSAPAFQRIAIGRNVAQVKKAFLIAGACLIFIKIIIVWIPFLIYSMNPSLESSQLVSYIVDTYSYPGLRGLMIVAIIAFAMSTADSRINSASVLFTHDICKVLLPTIKRELLISRLFAFLLGGGAIMFSLVETDLLSIIILANSFYYPIVLPPFLFTVFGFRSSSKSVLIGMMAGLVTNIIWKMSPIESVSLAQKIAGPQFALLMNAVFLLGSHYLLKQKGGWVGIKDNSYLDKQKIIRRERWAAFMSKVRSFNPINYIKTHPMSCDSTYVILGAYFLVFTFTSIYSTHAEMLKENKIIITTIYKTMIISSTMMGMYPIWPLSIKTEIKQMVMRVWYPLSIFYMLIVFSTFFVLLNEVNNLHFVMFAVNMIVSVILLGWQMALGMIVAGVYIGTQFYKYYIGVEYLDTSIGSPQFILLYSMLIVVMILIIFLKPKQEHHKKTEHKVGELSDEVGTLVTVVSSRDSQIITLDNKVSGLEERIDHYTERTTNQAQEIERLGATAQRILNNVNHELRLPVGNVMNFAEILHDGLGKLSDEQLKMLSKEVYKNSNRLSTMILNMLDLATLQAKKIELQIKLANFSELVEERLTACRKIYVEEKPLKFIIKIEKNVMVPMDENYIRQTIDNLVINAINFSEKGKILVIVARQTNFVTFTIKDQGIGIPLRELYDVFTPFKMGSNTETKAEGRGVGLALCKAAVNAHGGEVKVESSGAGVLFRVVLPLASDRGRPRS